MKIIVRSLVIALAVTGAIATSVSTPKAVASKTSAMPIPSCAPGSGDCGITQW